MTYEVYGYTYLSDGIWGELYLEEFDNKKDAIEFLNGYIDGMQFTGGAVYAVENPEDEESEIVYEV